MSNPCICIDGKAFVWVTGNKKTAVQFEHNGFLFDGLYYNHNELGHSNTTRFRNIARLLVNYVGKLTPGDVAFEGYAYGAKGRLFDIGECTGIAKSLFEISGWNLLNPFTPSMIKKEATGKGNANKLKMSVAWKEEHGFDVHDLFDIGTKKRGPEPGLAPAADIIDSYYVWKCLKKELWK